MAIYYRETTPPALPVAVMVQFDHYTGPTMHDGKVPITPIRRNWSSSGGQCSRLQLLLKLVWAVTSHKSQGLTLEKVVTDVGKEFSCGSSFVACSRVRKLRDILFMHSRALLIVEVFRRGKKINVYSVFRNQQLNHLLKTYKYPSLKMKKRHTWSG